MRLGPCGRFVKNIYLIRPTAVLTVSISGPDVQDIVLNVSHVTNTSVSLYWTPPSHPNGVIRNYFVHYQMEEVTQQQRDLIDSLNEQQSSNEKNVIKVYETKVGSIHIIRSERNIVD